MTRHMLYVAAAILAVVAGAACTNSPRTGDDLYLGQGKHAVCIPSPDQEDVASIFGDSVVEHRGDRPLVIESVDLVDADDMGLREAYLVEIHNRTLIGVQHENTDVEMPPTWEQRRDAVGARVEPGEVWNLVVLATDEGEGPATADSINLRYVHAGGGPAYQQQTVTSLRIAPNCTTG